MTYNRVLSDTEEQALNIKAKKAGQDPTFILENLITQYLGACVRDAKLDVDSQLNQKLSLMTDVDKKVLLDTLVAGGK